MIQVTVKRALPDGSVVKMSLEEAKRHDAALAAQRAEAEKAKLAEIQQKAGAYRLIYVGPGGVSQLFASNDERAHDVLSRKLPFWLEQNIGAPQSAFEPLHGRTKFVRILRVPEGGSTLQPGDRISLTEFAQVLKVSNVHSYLSQAKNVGKKEATARGVTFCREEDYADLATKAVSI